MVNWAVNTAKIYDSTFRPLIEKYDGQMLILGESSFHVKTTNKPTQEKCDPENIKICKQGVWNDQMLIETFLSMLTAPAASKEWGIGSGQG